MDPITGTALVVGLVLWGIASSCGTHYDFPPTPMPDGGGNPKPPDGGHDCDCGCSDASDAGPPPDPQVCPGLNGNFSTPTYGFQGCSVNRDLRFSTARIFGVCGPSSNKTFSIGIDPTNPLASSIATMGDGPPSSIWGVSGEIFPARSVEMKGGFLALFSGEAAPLVSGFSYIGAGKAADTTTFKAIGDVMPYKPFSAAVAKDGKGKGRLVVPASNANANDASILVSYPLNADGSPNDFVPPEVMSIAGMVPVDISMLFETTALVVNATGDLGASIETINTACMNAAPDATDGGTSADAGSAACPDPTKPTIASLPIGKDILTRPAPVWTPDLRYLLAVTPENNLIVVDRTAAAGQAVVGTLALGELPRGLSVTSQGRAVASFATSIRTIDLATPTQPRFVKEIAVGTNLGPVAISGAGDVYVSATARWWEKADLQAGCKVDGVATLCQSHIIAIDPSAVLPAASETEDGGMGDTNGTPNVSPLCPRAVKLF